MLEASAGTGKTFTIAGLATRWVAETEVRLPQLLVVTFTRAATAELRDRVRARLVQAADHVEAVLGGAPVDRDDPVLDRVAGIGDRDELRRRQARLARALTDVDVATIATIHGFCQHVLDGLGIASDLDRDAELVDDVAELVEEVVDDLLVATWLEPTDTPRLDRDTLLHLGRVAVANPTTPLVPDASTDPVAALRVQLAHRIRTEVARRARQRRLLSYDDLLTRLDATLHDPARGGAARAALRQRYRVTLIDEFQDTDPVQWRIVSRAFTDTPDDTDTAGRALVLIGDPKQAIYAFRGADVHAYLQARRQAAVHRTLGTSWRSDAGVLTAFGALFDGVHFGHPDIPHRPVDAAPGHDAPRYLRDRHATPLRLRVVPRHPSFRIWEDKPNAAQVRDLVARDLAADVVALLEDVPELADRDADGVETRRRALEAGDVAVLVRSHAQAELVHDALRAVDVPAVVGGAGSVFLTPAATDWRRLLDALERPAASSRVRALALSHWIGWTADRLAAATEQDWDRLHEDVHRWARTLTTHGVAATFRSILLQREVRRRLLGEEGGERVLADLEHLAELAHAAATGEHLGPTGLATWFRDQVAEAQGEGDDERLRRLETDRDAVQILTIHGSKGLEFPVVYCPYLWSSSGGASDVPVFHDDAGDRLVDVGGTTHPEHADHVAAAEDELRGEELRLLYVAMTRAKHQVVAWYAPAGMPEWSGLGRVLLCRDDAGTPHTDQPAPLLDDAGIRAACDRLAATSAGTLVVEEVGEHPADAPWRPTDTDLAELDRARFTRALDQTWRRTSYSALTALDVDDPRVGSEPGEPVKDDEPTGAVDEDEAEGGVVGDDDPHGLRATALPLADLPGGRHVGTFVHGVLEHTDFAAADLDAEVRGVVEAQLRARRLDLDPDLLVTGVRAAIETPLGDAAGGLALRDVARSHRRDEMGFELPLHLAGGRPAVLGDVVALLADHLPADDPLAGYPDAVPAPLLDRPLRGFLGGFIDLIVRRPGPDGDVFHVIDHKTNRLGVWGEPLTAFDYRQDALAGAMAHGHYPVQALLYAVAMHRTLRWRLGRAYDPGRSLGSVLYLFLRGMAGPATPAPDGRPCGVFAWDPPASLITATSDLLHGGPA